MKKRILTLAMVLLLCMGLTTPALAATDAANGLTKIQVSGANGQTLYGYKDQNGNEVIPPEYTNLDDFYDGVTLGQKGGTYYLLNAVGQVIDTFSYDYMSSFAEAGGAGTVAQEGRRVAVAYGYSLVESGNKYGIMDTSGNMVIPVEYDRITFPSKDSYALAKYDAQGNLKWGTKYMPIQYDDVIFTEIGGWVALRQSGKWGLYDEWRGQKELLPFEYDSMELLDKNNNFSLEMVLVVGKDGKYGCFGTYYNSEGKWIVPLEYDWIGLPFRSPSPSSENTFVTVKQGEKYGCYNMEGRLVKKVQYSDEQWQKQRIELQRGKSSKNWFAQNIPTVATVLVTALLVCAFLVLPKKRQEKKAVGISGAKTLKGKRPATIPTPSTPAPAAKSVSNTVPTPKVAPASGPKFCPECGKPLAPSVKFCPECGHSLNSGEG